MSSWQKQTAQNMPLATTCSTIMTARLPSSSLVFCLVNTLTLFCMASVSAAPYTSCRICTENDCCTASISAPGVGTCTVPSSIGEASLWLVPERPLWLDVVSGDRSMGFQLFPAEHDVHAGTGTWVQVVGAHAFFPFVEDLLFFNTTRPSVCSRRWGCLSCYSQESSEHLSCTSGGWVNMTITAASPSSPCGLEHPSADVYWWGEDIGHGVGHIQVCMGFLPQQLQPQPPSPVNTKAYGVSWSVNFGGKHDGIWPLSQWAVSCV